MRKPLVVGLVCLGSRCFGQNAGDQDLGNMGIEDLMKLQVTISSRQQESFRSVPAAIYVLSGDDIRRSGATTLPDMLRMVPGVHVAQIDQSHWQVSIRGFGSRYSNKLQVLVDGRSIYTPLFSGVYWESNPVSPEEIERIEIVRGPGGALWGANAVNGVINVITKDAAHTQGTSLGVGTGDVQNHNHDIMHGGKLGDAGFFRIYARYLGFKDLDAAGGGANSDGWESLFVGTRMDWKLSESDLVHVDARLTSNHQRQFVPTLNWESPFTTTASQSSPATDWSLNGSWKRQISESQSSELRASLTHSDHDAPEIRSNTTVLDLDYQHTTTWTNQSRLVVGASYRHYSDELEGTDLISSAKANERNQVFSAYADYERSLGRRVKLRIGSTIEHNDNTGVEVQPSIRFMWDRNDRENYWLSAARAVRTPSRADTDMSIHTVNMAGESLPVAVYLLGNPQFKSEVLTSFELGGRLRATKDLFIDVAAFYNAYDNLRSFDEGTPFVVMSPVPHVVAPYTFGNNLQAETGGLEVSATYQPTQAWKLDGSLSYLTDYFHLKPGTVDLFGTHSGERQGDSPNYMGSLRSSHSLNHNLNIDLSAHFVGRATSAGIPAYSRFDARVGWKPCADAELSLVIQNLFDNKHFEANSTLFETPSLFRRSITGQLRWKF